MTNDNNTRKKANAVFFSVLMVISMVAVGFAAAPAAATVTAVTGQSAEDVPLDQTSAAQDVSFVVTDNGTGSSQTLTLDVSAAENNNIDASLSASDVSTNATGISSVTDNSDSSGTIDIVLDTSGSSTTNDFSVDATLTHNTSGVANSATNLNPVSFSLTSNGNSGSVSFDLTPANRGVVGDTTQITNNSLVFQGEDDIEFVDSSGNTVPVSNLEGTSGDREGVPLRIPIPTDASPGRYAGPSGFATTVQSPSIDTAGVRLNGNDISQISVENAVNGSNGNTFVAFAEYNFDEAEDVSVTVEDPNGDDITGEVTPSGDTITSDSSGIPLDFAGEDAGEYTLTFEGSDDLDQDAVVEEYTLDLTDQDQLSIEVNDDPITQGSNNGYTVSGGTNGQQHVVAIQAEDFREGGFTQEDYQSIFRNTGDTEVTGVYDAANTPSQLNTSDTNATAQGATADYAFAVVEIDGTTATGSINAGLLDDSSIDVDVYNASSVSNVNISNLNSADDVDFDVEEGDVTLDSPTGDYTVGEEVDVNGTATSADESDSHNF